MTPREYAAAQRERYRTDPVFRAAKLAANRAYLKAHPEQARETARRWRERTFGVPVTRTPADRFWSKVAKQDGCWIWTGARDTNGYGNFYVAGCYLKAHRFALELVVGPLAPGLQACHRCDNPPCVRPDHLFAGTNADNAHDRIAKGRPGSPGPRVASRGEGRWSAKLTAAHVAEIRAAYAAGGVRQADLAAKYGVRQGQISRIISGARWRP